MHFLSLTEMDAVLAINSNVSHLSCVREPGIELSALPAPAHLFPLRGFV